MTEKKATTKKTDTKKVSSKKSTKPIAAQEEILLTKEWYEKLKVELNDLKTAKRKEVAERLKEAISYWDLSENSEYEEAKNEQAFVEWRIIELEKKIKYSKIISDSHTTKINVGSTIELQEASSKEKYTFTIVWSTEAEPFKWRISNESPLGKALIWLKKGDKAIVNAPRWEITYNILNIL